MRSLIIPLLLIASCTSSPESKTLGVQVLGYFEQEAVDSVRSALSTFYNVEIIQLPNQKLPKSAFVNIKSPRYRADSLLNFLTLNKADSLDYLMALTYADISFTKRVDGDVKEPITRYEDWGIFGLAHMPGTASVISSYRINSTSKKVFFSRLKKITVHEFGHNLGLPHCSNKTCIMQDAAESISTIDNVELKMCSSCFEKIN